MMGKPAQRENKLFYIGVNLGDRVPPDHVLRQVAAVVDCHFIRDHVADSIRASLASALSRAARLPMGVAQFLGCSLLTYQH